MAIDANQVQAAVYGLLTGANVCSSRIYDQGPPDNATYPYVLIGATDESPDDDSTGLGIDYEMTLEIWSEQPGKKEANTIRKAIGDALHLQSFTTGNGTACLCWVDGGPTLQDPEGVGWQGIVRVRIQARK